MQVLAIAIMTRCSVRRFELACCLALLTVVGGSCGPSRKELTEASGRALVREYIRSQKQSFTVPLAPILSLMNRTREDYTAQGSSSGPKAAFRRLLDRKLVVQSPTKVSYPVISGQFSQREIPPSEHAQFTSDHKDHWIITTYTLRTLPNSNSVTGEFERTVDPPYEGHEAILQRYAVEGSILADGGVDMHFSGPAPTLGGLGRFAYVEDGPAAYLQDRTGRKYVGRASGAKVELKEYDYSFSRDMERRIEGKGQQAVASGGAIEIGELSGLRLDSDTEASAEFTWHVALDEVGRALLGDDVKTGGNGEAVFGKKPDGTWFVVRVDYSGR